MSEENVHTDIINEDNPITDELASSEVQIEESSNGTETETNTRPEIPEKYRGKSAEEIIEMHANAEKELSRLGNELGQNRQLVDKLLQAEATAPVQAPVEDVADWDYNPEEAAAQLVNKEVGAIKSELNQMKQATALEQFKSKYPNFESDASSSEFMDWVQASPYRVNLYNKNYQGTDLIAAAELMNGWEDVKTSTPQQSQEDLEAKRKADLKAAKMEKGSSSGTTRKNTWSRSYIRKLRLEDPQKYALHKDEIMLAYAEDRVTK